MKSPVKCELCEQPANGEYTKVNKNKVTRCIECAPSIDIVSGFTPIDIVTGFTPLNKHIKIKGK